MSNYTQGDWRLGFRDSQTDGVNVCFSIYCEQGTTICDGQSQEHLGEGFILEDECRANAHLLRSAKELFEALDELLSDVGRASSLPSAIKARAAIAKALGEVGQADQIAEAA